jgi:hypothetical protein
MIAGNYAADIGSNGFDNACAFVPSDPGIATVGHITSDEVLIGVAQARRDVAYEHLSALWLVDFDVFDRPTGVLRTPHHCCSALNHNSPYDDLIASDYFRKLYAKTPE